MTTKFDAIIIGTGQSGPALAHELADKGRRVAVIERQDFGGSCVNFGCIPTKAYVASAQVANHVRTSAEYGIEVDDFKVDLKRVKARKDELVNDSTSGVEMGLRDSDQVTVIEGHARFVGPGVVGANNETFTADNIFINVGARADVPEIAGLNDVSYLTSTDMLELDEVPEHLAIIGGGYVGIEFAQMFRRFGARVSVIQRDKRVLNTEDEDVSTGVQKILESEGVDVLTDVEPQTVRKSAEGIVIELSGDHPNLKASHLLVATGRVPNTDTLGVKESGIELDEHGYIKVDQHLRTNVEGIFALGDCNGQGAFTHTSYNDFEIVRNHLFGDSHRKLSDRIPAHAVYIDPPLARVGITESEARTHASGVLKAKLRMDKVGRARETGETDGFMKVLVEESSGLILGATILGLHGDEVIHSILDVMYARKPFTVIRDAVHIHPTVSELVPTMLESLEPLN
ncbi:MAG: FAD-containing oxidoreductase [Planctomycetes bacterium]|nr:FAD-containing oxidoreductase [Planctomycetota bacterium]